MEVYLHRRSGLNKITFYCFILLLFTVPLIVTAHTGNPFVITKNDAFKINAGIFFILCLLLLLQKHQSKLIIHNRFDPYVILFFLAAVISTIFSINPFLSFYGYFARPLGLEIYLYIFLVYIFSSFILRDKDSILKTINLMELCALIVSSHAILQFLGADPLKLQPLGDGRPLSTLGNGNFLGGFLILVFPFSLIRIARSKEFSFTFLSPLIILSAIIISFTRAAYVAAAIEIAVILFLYPFVKDSKEKLMIRFKYSIFISGLLVILLCFVVILFKDNVYVERFLSITLLFKETRWILWQDSLRLFSEYPVFGCGLSAFSLAFENVYSIKFKLLDLYNYYDNAHSNFIQILCTMGILGISAYLLLLGHTIFILLRSIFSKTLDTSRKILFIAFLSMLFGYIIYGIADFDEVTILLYFFIYLSLLKSLYLVEKDSGQYTLPGSNLRSKLYLSPVIVIILLFISYNFYLSYQHIRSDKYYGIAYSLASQKNYSSALDNFRLAINLWENNSYYHFLYAGTILCAADKDTVLNTDKKMALLKEARFQFLVARENYPSKIECNAFICLTDYELGDTLEAEKLKAQLLSRDSLMIAFRISLSHFYIKNKIYNKAIEQLLFLSHYDTENEMFLKDIADLLKDEYFPDPSLLCKKILAIDPKNQIANQFLRTRQ